MDVIENGLNENEKYLGFFEELSTGDKKWKIVFWRVADHIYAKVFQKKEEWTSKSKKWKFMYNLYRDLASNEDCLKVLPDGCKYSGTATDYFSQVCEGYVTLPEKIHTGLIHLSVETGLNPENVAEGFAECIKRHINTFSIRMECALEGIQMDHEWAV